MSFDRRRFARVGIYVSFGLINLILAIAGPEDDLRPLHGAAAVLCLLLMLEDEREG